MKKPPKTADTPEALLEHLGGINAVAHLCATTPQAVRHWKARGFPAHYIPVLKIASRARRIQVAPKLFEPRLYRRRSTIGADRVAP